MESMKLPKNIETLLVRAGLTNKEAKIYLALLSLGKGTVSEITRAAGIGRTYGYAILDILASKDLISVSGKEPKQEFIAESPRKLYEFLEREVVSRRETLAEVKNNLPELISLHSVEDRPKVRFYEGLEGIKEIYEDTLTAKERPLRGYAKYEELHGTLKNYFPEYYKRRTAKGIFGRALITDTPLGRERKRRDQEEAREIKLVPKEKFDISPEINIYDNKVMIVSWREKLGIIIESGEIADAMKKIFDLVWEARS
jgi:sugar-specific transcriptional regulator TrmB